LWARLRQRHGVVRYPLFDHLPHLRGGSKETVRRHRPRNPLVRPPEVVGLNKQRQAPLAVFEIRTHRPRQKLLPQRLPEAFDLAQRLRVVRAALDVPDALPPQLPLEIRVPTPGHVLPPLVREHLLGRTVLRNAARERLQDQG
jgi:hypothetical protein